MDYLQILFWTHKISRFLTSPLKTHNLLPWPHLSAQTSIELAFMKSTYALRHHRPIIQCYYGWTVFQQMPEVAGLIYNNKQKRMSAPLEDDCQKDAVLLSVYSENIWKNFKLSATNHTQHFPHTLTENLSKLVISGVAVFNVTSLHRQDFLCPHCTLSVKSQNSVWRAQWCRNSLVISITLSPFHPHLFNLLSKSLFQLLEGCFMISSVAVIFNAIAIQSIWLNLGSVML